MPDFLLPDLGEGLTEADIVNWLVAVGDEVSLDQPVVEVETAKAVVEVPVPYAGIVTAVHGRPGQCLPVGAPLITIGSAKPAAGGRLGRGKQGSDKQGSDQKGSDQKGSGNVLIGYGTADAAPRRHRARNGRKSAQDPALRMSRGTITAPPVLAGPTDVRRVISPAVRTLARNAGVDLTAIPGSGTDGIISRHDVEREIQRRAVMPDTTVPDTPVPDTAAPDAAAPGTAAPRTALTDTAVTDAHFGNPDDGPVRRLPMTGVRRLVAEKMSRSRREIPEATVWVDVDATEMLAARAVINEADPDRKVSILALFAKFAVLGLRRYPELNGRIDGQHIVLPEHVHLGVAAQTDRGLVVPVIRGAQALSTRQLSAAIAERATMARAGKLAPQDFSGSTFTVNNYGVFGVDGSAAIINYPEVAILGLGRIIDRPWVVDGAVVARKVAQLSLVFDHRVCDGGVAGGYLRFVADCVEAPLGVLGEI